MGIEKFENPNISIFSKFRDEKHFTDAVEMALESSQKPGGFAIGEPSFIKSAVGSFPQAELGFWKKAVMNKVKEIKEKREMLEDAKRQIQVEGAEALQAEDETRTGQKFENLMQ